MSIEPANQSRRPYFNHPPFFLRNHFRYAVAPIQDLLPVGHPPLAPLSVSGPSDRYLNNPTIFPFSPYPTLDARGSPEYLLDYAVICWRVCRRHIYAASPTPYDCLRTFAFLYCGFQAVHCLGAIGVFFTKIATLQNELLKRLIANARSAGHEQFISEPS